MAHMHAIYEPTVTTDASYSLGYLREPFTSCQAIHLGIYEPWLRVYNATARY